MALIVAGSLVAYHNTFTVPFLFDDVPSIRENASIRDLGALGQVLFPDQAGGLTTSGRPVVNLSLALNYALSGYAVGSYHAVNLAIHIAAALCLFGLVRRTLVTPPLRDRFGTHALPLAAVTALLWALHPLQTESVTYVVQRAESLVAFFYLLTLYAFRRAFDFHVLRENQLGTAGAVPASVESAAWDARRSRSVRRARAGWLAVSVAACLLGMATKEVMVSAPLVVFLYDRTFLGGTFREAWRRHGRWHLALAATWLVLAALVLSTGNRGGTVGFGTDISAWSYALTQCEALVRYVALSLWPAGLVFDYGTATASGLASVFPQAVLVLSALAGTVFALRRWPAAGFLLATFFLVLAPSSSFVPVATQTIAEHRMYLPLAALVAGLMLAGFRALGRAALGFAAAAVVLCTGATIGRNGDYASELSIWSDSVAKFPGNARAHNNLGQALFRAGRVGEAIARYGEALRLQPKYPESHYNLGVAFMAQGRVDEAIGAYEAALRLEPGYPEALNNLGNALFRVGRGDEAVRRYEEAIRRRAAFPEAHHNLGHALLQANRPREARPHFERALQHKPDYAEAHYNLGNAHAAAGDMPAALESYLAALRHDPHYAAAHVNAGNALLELRRSAEALTHYDAAIAADPALVDAHYNRGSVLLGLGRWNEAVPAFETVLRLQPEHADTHRALGFALAQTGRPNAAIPHYERYLALRPADTEAQQELAQLRRR